MSGGRSLAVVLVVGALAGCGGSHDRRLATVGDRQITRSQVDALVEHAREEVGREGQTLPSSGSDGYRSLERQALAVLVGRAKLEQAARRLGVTVDDAEIDRFAARPHVDLPELAFEKTLRGLGIPEANEKGASARALRDAVRIQLTIEKVERKLGRPGFDRWYANARQLDVRYADGWDPAAYRVE